LFFQCLDQTLAVFVLCFQLRVLAHIFSPKLEMA
jgi:hypothetical protein